MLRNCGWLCLVAGVAFLAAGLYFVRRRRWLGVALALGAFFLAGALHIQLRGATPLLDTGLLPFADGQPIQMTAHVTREGKLREGKILFSVHSDDSEKTKRAKEIFERAGAEDISTAGEASVKDDDRQEYKRAA